MNLLHRGLIALAIALALIFLPGQLGARTRTPGLERIRGEKAALEEGNAALELEIAALQSEVRALRNQDQAVPGSTHALERAAREDLNLIREGDVVFEVVRTTSGRKEGT